MNKINFTIVKKNRANFRIEIIQNDTKELADLVIDPSTENFEAGQEIEGYLIKQKVNPKFIRKGALNKYTFSEEVIEITPDVFATFNAEAFRYEVKCEAKYSNICKKHKFTWNPDRMVWQTYSYSRVSKVIQSFVKQGLIVSKEDAVRGMGVIRVLTEKAVERDKTYTEDSHINLSESDIDRVVEMLQGNNSICAGFFWKSDYAEYRKFEYKNGGLFGTHNKVTLQNYRQQFKTREYVRRVCHGFDCKTVEQLLTRL
ncbi:hypothetical protein MZJ41_004722 [Vibrio parahaemolyticus]|nr:hypothetical protein [Vibrio parahaemolyticus]EJC6794442.1 hypothetical protein [Vibrio parahaemolyticus]EJC6856257.1 hypothetical protein [Vibrio parahaemolyticus]EJC6985433.1 hypothetical protein [Vibrio parahaemolyticus]EJC7053593.1 hypothetical protein [Vibrio parahaemolyticus]